MGSSPHFRINSIATQSQDDGYNQHFAKVSVNPFLDGFFMGFTPPKTIPGFLDSGTFLDIFFGINYFDVPEIVPESRIVSEYQEQFLPFIAIRLCVGTHTAPPALAPAS